MEAQTKLHPSFQHSQYLFRRKVFRIFGGAFHIYDKNGKTVFFCNQKAFRLKEDFRIYSDESMREPLLIIKTPQILDLGATYYVQDANSLQRIGALKRKWAKSIFKDEWTFLSLDEREIGKLSENSFSSALLSRLINLIPQSYTIETTLKKPVATIKQHFNPFILKYTMNIIEPTPSIDIRLLIAAGILLAAIERRQQ